MVLFKGNTKGVTTPAVMYAITSAADLRAGPEPLTLCLIEVCRGREAIIIALIVLFEAEILWEFFFFFFLFGR